MDNNTEIWKDIEGYEGYYQVSNLGRVKSVDRIINCNGSNAVRKGVILKNHSNKYRSNYQSVRLSKNNSTKTFYVHRLVAKSFSEICGEWFEGCEIDHIDCDTQRNVATNLKVTDKKGNMNNPKTKLNCSKAYTDERRKKYSERMKHENPSKQEWDEKKKNSYRNSWKKNGEKLRIKVKQMDKEGNLIKEWSSFTEIEKETGMDASNINAACRNKYKTMYGFKWAYGSN